MQDIEYIMVTDWDRHWDKLENRRGSSTLFTLPFIRDNVAGRPWPLEATTLFIKRAKGTNHIERSWIGKAKNFRADPNKGKPAVRFEVSELKEIECLPEFNQYSNGWHLNNLQIIQPAHLSANNTKLQPPFLSKMTGCDWKQFEEYCFLLLKLLGIHEIHRYPETDNRGKADGFFIFHKLSVLYDVTTLQGFDTQKATQIDNYINQLNGDKVTVGSYTYTTRDKICQVWVITRGSTTRLIKTVDMVKVKEIPYTKLIDIYNQRLNNEIDGSEKLFDTLKDLH